MDREKAIKGLEQFKADLKPFCGNRADWERFDAGVALLKELKEQEAVEPTLIREGRNKYYSYYVCPRCGDEVVYDQNYCSECGVRFLWEGR
jgi:rubrerythrin